MLHSTRLVALTQLYPLTGVSGLLHAAQDGYELTQHKIVNLMKIFFFFSHQFSLVFVYLMCGPRQLFFFHCGPEMPKG